ncbi:MAG: hypothetical protein KBT07_06145 [Clostridiales bacterium]|nr:hypothetical protein [Candidatus Scatonaster coprocaballi]
MGFFDAMKSVGAAMKEGYQANRAAAEAEQVYQATLTAKEFLVFSPFTAEQIAVADSVKAGLFGKGEKKKFMESMRNGTAGFAEVIVLDETELTESNGDSSRSSHYGAIQTTSDGTKYQGYFYEPSGQVFYPMSWYDDDEMLEDGTYIDNTANKPKKKGYIIHYFIGKEEQYALLDEDNFRTFAFLKYDPVHYMKSWSERK